MVGAKVFTTKQHCHCHDSNLIPNDDDPKRNVGLSSDRFHVGETILYINAGQTLYIRIEEISLDEKAVLQFRVRTTNNEMIETTKESLQSPDDPDIGWIPTMLPEKKQFASNLTEKEIDDITSPVSLSSLQEEFVSLHERLWHLPFTVIFRLVKFGFLSKKFQNIINKAHPCVSSLFGTAHKKPWRFKKTKYGHTSTLRGDDISGPGDTVGVDLLILAQP